MRHIIGGISFDTACMPKLDPGFVPLASFCRAYRRSVEKSGGIPLKIALHREGGQVGVYETRIHGTEDMRAADELFVARTVKTLLWSWGGWKIVIAGSDGLTDVIRGSYCQGGEREFDAKFMTRVYEKPFSVESAAYEAISPVKSSAAGIGRHLGGCRIGLDAGASFLKVSAVADGNVVWSSGTPWAPATNSNPDYHFNCVMEALKSAAARLPRVDALGVSSAGVFVANRAMVASLFRGVSEEDFNAKIKDIYIRAAKELGGVPLEVANDGDVTALAGALDLNETGFLGIAMGSSQAGGFVDAAGNLTGWLNELAFVPLDLNPRGTVDDWSGDTGCGVKYLSQDGAVKLASATCIQLDEAAPPAASHRSIHDLMERGDERAASVYETIGCYLGHALAHYAEFYRMRHVLLMGGVVSGRSGSVILEQARQTLMQDYPETAATLTLYLPDEESRRMGLSVAAASLPEIAK